MSFRLLAVALMSAWILSGCGSAAERSADYVERAREYLAEDDYVKARLDLRNAVKIDPENVEARMLLVDIAERERNGDAMSNQLQRILVIEPENAEAHRRFGLLLLASARQTQNEELSARLIEQAREHIDEAVRLEPDSPDARVLDGLLRQASGDREGAFARAREVLAEHPDNVAAVSLLSSLHVPEEPELALAAVEEGLAASPDSVALHLLKVSLLRRLERWDAVQATLEELRDRFPDAKPFAYRLASFHVERESFDAAESVLEELVAQYPEDTTAKLQYAEFLANHRAPEISEQRLQQFVEENPEVQDFRFALATLYSAVDRLDAAAATYQEIIEREGSGDVAVKARNRLAEVYLAQGQLDAARTQIDAVLEESPADPIALTMRGGLRIDAGELDSAIIDLRTAYRSDPQSKRTLALLGQAHLRAGDVNLAEERFREYHDAYPEDTAARDQLAGLLVSRGRFADARRVLEDSTAPRTVQSVRLLADVLTRERDFDAAREVAAPLIEMQGEAAAVGHFLTARIYQAEQRHEEAIDSLQQAVDIVGVTPDLLSALVTSLVLSDRQQEALERIEAWQRDNPERFEGYALAGQVHARARQWEEARAALERALELDDGRWTTYRDLAGVHLARGDSASAIATLDRGLTARPEDTRLRLLLAQIQESNGDYLEAIDSYERILETEPDSAVAANNLAALIADNESSPERLQYALKLTERLRTSGNPLYLDTIGWLNYRMGNIEEALLVLERAVASAEGVAQLESQLPQLRYHLGMAYYRAQQMEAARRELRAAVEAAPQRGFPGLEEARDTLAQL